MDWRAGFRTFSRFMHSWFVTVIFAVLFMLTLFGWLLVGARFAYDKVVRDDWPAPPPSQVVPIPTSWKVLTDESCAGNHCSTRTLTLHSSTPLTVPDMMSTFTTTFDKAGYRTRPVNGKVVADAEPITMDLTWTQGDTVEDVTITAGFTSPSAGRTYWQDAIAYKHIDGFRHNLMVLTIATVGLIIVLRLTESAAQDPP